MDSAIYRPCFFVCFYLQISGVAMNIIELAMQAGFVEYELDDGTTEAFDKRYAKFAALVAAHEREACAYRAGIALLGADRGLAHRVDQAIQTWRTTT
jgi:hypothetical protein